MATFPHFTSSRIKREGMNEKASTKTRHTTSPQGGTKVGKKRRINADPPQRCVILDKVGSVHTFLNRYA